MGEHRLPELVEHRRRHVEARLGLGLEDGLAHRVLRHRARDERDDDAKVEAPRVARLVEDDGRVEFEARDRRRHSDRRDDVCDLGDVADRLDGRLDGREVVLEPADDRRVVAGGRGLRVREEGLHLEQARLVLRPESVADELVRVLGDLLLDRLDELGLGDRALVLLAPEAAVEADGAGPAPTHLLDAEHERLGVLHREYHAPVKVVEEVDLRVTIGRERHVDALGLEAGLLDEGVDCRLGRRGHSLASELGASKLERHSVGGAFTRENCEREAKTAGPRQGPFGGPPEGGAKPEFGAPKSKLAKRGPRPSLTFALSSRFNPQLPRARCV